MAMPMTISSVFGVEVTLALFSQVYKQHDMLRDNQLLVISIMYTLQSFTFTFTTIQARPLYEAYVLGSVSVLTRCYCSVFNVHTPVLKALRLGAVTREAGKAFHCSRVLGKKSVQLVFDYRDHRMKQQGANMLFLVLCLSILLTQ